MKKKIFYFSGTGNTYILSKKLAEEMGDTELIKIRKDMEYEHKDAEIAGIAYPVYCFVQPNIVTEFISKVELSRSAYIFGLASYGGLLCFSGYTLKDLLAKRSYELAAGFAVNMPGNATSVYDVIAKDKQEAMFSSAEIKIKEIADIVNSGRHAAIDTNKGLLGKLLTKIGPAMMKNIHKSDKAFYADEKCDSCAVCSEICPVDNIQMKGSKPVWNNNCESCFACLHWCPHAAIQSGSKTSSRGRYHHPEVSLSDMIK